MDDIFSWTTALMAPVISVLGAPGKREYIIFLLANALLALFVYLRRSRRPSLRGAIHYCLPFRLFLHPSAIVDYKIWIINGVLLMVAAPALALAGYGTYRLTWLLAELATGMPEGLGWTSQPAWVVLATVVQLLALDAALFSTHYAMHKVPFLWEFHKTHHSATVMTPFTVFRVHPVDMFLTAVVDVFLGAITGTLLSFVLGTNPAVTIFGLNAFVVAFYLLGYHLRHSHVWLMFPGFIGRQISSPALHLIHHSANPRHWDKNMAHMFTFWDRLAGTLYLPSEEEKITFGIGNGEDDAYRTLPDMYFRAFRFAFGKRGNEEVANARDSAA